MKKPLIAAAISMALASVAQAETQFYGKMNVSVSYNDLTEDFDLNEHASRLGVKGSDDLGSVKVVYQAEFSNPTDTGGIGARDTFVGLAYPGIGTMKMGLMDTPLKKSQGKFDLFNDVVDIKNVLDGENRRANSVNFTTEKLGALQVSFSAVLNNSSDNPGISDTDGYSASVTYSKDAIYAAVAYDTKVNEESVQRATFIYNMGEMTVGALINNVDTADTADAELGLGLNASMTKGANTFKVQYVSGDQKASGRVNLSAGVDHKLAKTTKAYAVATINEEDNTFAEYTALIFGLEHKF